MFPNTKEQRCWWHKIGNVLAALPKSAHPGAKKALAELYNAENRDQAMKAAKVFVAVAMAFKLIESAQRRWRMVNAPSSCRPRAR